MTYIIRTCPIVEGNFRTQVSFNSRPELIIESYELYISTSEPASARNSNEESPVFDPLQLVIGMVRKHHDGEQGYVSYRLQKYSWKEPVNGTPDDCSKNFSGKISRSNGMSEKGFLFFRSCFLSSNQPLIPL